MNKLTKPSRAKNLPAGAPAQQTPQPQSAQAAKPFSWPVRVYYEDTDAGGVVYYANYLAYMERARTEWLRALGFEQPQLAASHGVLFVVRSVAIDYLRPSRFNDSLQVTVEVVNVGGSRIRFLQRVLRDDEDIARAEVDVVCVDTGSLRPARMPREMREKMETTGIGTGN